MRALTTRRLLKLQNYEACLHIIDILSSCDIGTTYYKSRKGLQLKCDHNGLLFFIHIERATFDTWNADNPIPNTKIDRVTVPHRLLTYEGDQGYCELSDRNIPAFFLKTHYLIMLNKWLCVNGDLIVNRYRGGKVVMHPTSLDPSTIESFVTIRPEDFVYGPEESIKYMKKIVTDYKGPKIEGYESPQTDKARKAINILQDAVNGRRL